MTAAVPPVAVPPHRAGHHYHRHHGHVFHQALQRAAALPNAARDGIGQAMALESVPESWRGSLEFLCQRESGGQVGVRSPNHSATGLFQLTAVNYHCNPRGAASFGDATEEAQGGIRYIQARYGTADDAATFWRAHHWY